MAKALLGYVATPSVHQQVRETQLRRRIADLEAEVVRLKHENDELSASTDLDQVRLSTADLLETAGS
ncbi:hypothetical protein KV102_16050 [Mumia sp. zg.B53]|jgi:cell division protein FtsL|uniref:hypothetical protein n=1 Tax=unclassified Mumia TaxID=2621872 RepID=UPI001C6F41D6|nr:MULTISPECIES: hypothetical protein [unclassified Mumia]MBW9205605.1 hypothetical protein [Mumia sp. zg.B17]MBW9208393.1 hypothetical protein [Mumia sp. zg.B21]MBW9216351.1 hypothetical protein [Mumia sp. zg.B53]MDD9348877.1 hypothetical protein [Mumia sp.]